jgi:hypothetical protein
MTSVNSINPEEQRINSIANEHRDSNKKILIEYLLKKSISGTDNFDSIDIGQTFYLFNLVSFGMRKILYKKTASTTPEENLTSTPEENLTKENSTSTPEEILTSSPEDLHHCFTLGEEGRELCDGPDPNSQYYITDVDKIGDIDKFNDKIRQNGGKRKSRKSRKYRKSRKSRKSKKSKKSRKSRK